MLTIAFLSLALISPVPDDTTSDPNKEKSKEDRKTKFWNQMEGEIDEFVDRMIKKFHDPDTVTRTTSPAESSETPQTRQTKPSHFRSAYVYTAKWDEAIQMNHFHFRYNRVEGVFIGVGSPKKYHWEEGSVFHPYGSIGYGFVTHRWRALLGLAQQLELSANEGERLIEIGIDGHSYTDSKDHWLIPEPENTAWALLINQDHMDYFQRQGVTVHLSHLYRNDDFFSEVKVGFSVDDYQSLTRNVGWSLIRSGTWRENPAIDDGDMRSIHGLIGLNTVARKKGPEGWNIQLVVESAHRDRFGGNFTFDQYLANVTSYQRLGRSDHLNFRFRIGTAKGNLPLQKSYELGGLGTLPAFGYKSLGDPHSNRMMLVNAEYALHGDFLGDMSFWPSFIMRHLRFLLLADAGLVRLIDPDASPLQGFGGIHWSEFRSDLGFGVSTWDGSVRIAWLWRTDVAAPATVTFRVSRPF